MRNGVAVDITDVFSADGNPIHVWFRLSGFATGTTLTSRWTYLGGAQPLVIGTAEVLIGPTNDYGTFNYELAEGKRWPAGEYRIEILSGTAVVGRPRPCRDSSSSAAGVNVIALSLLLNEDAAAWT